jgi:hypothetical protein
MNLKDGFQIDEPHVFVPWSVTQAELRALLGPRLREVAQGYFTISCTSLGGMEHSLGFHFDPPASDNLTELEFFQASAMPLADSYADFQRHFEQAFGPPKRSRPGTEGFPTHEWAFPSLLPTVRIIHLVQERFGPEEHMRIRNVSRLTSFWLGGRG